jgi:serine/threonine protein kinase
MKESTHLQGQASIEMTELNMGDAAATLNDRYQVQQQLENSEGRDTLLAKDLFTQEWVVIKRLFCQNCFAVKEIELFQREAETLKTLCHPAIPRYLDYFEFSWQEGNGFALVQSYIPGRSLQHWLNDGHRLNEDAARQVATSLLDVLVDLHERQPPIIHRDIHPGNILINTQADQPICQVHLVGFSAVQNFASATIGSFTVVGTYGYTAPEQLSGRPVKASDLYSLGVSLIHAMTGIAPAKLPHKGRRIDFEACLSASPTFIHWLKQLVEPGLEQRFTSACIALQALKAAQSQSTLAPQKPAYSRVTVHQKSDHIEVVVPATIGKLRLCIDDRHLIVTYEVMGWRYNQLPPIRRVDLRKFQCTRHHIILWLSTQELELSTSLSKAEVSWLVHELNQRLKIAVCL